MVITGIKQYYVDRFHFVKVETDEGLFGMGEATLRAKQPAIAEIIDLLAKQLVGQDVLDKEWNFNKFFGYDRWRGGVIVNTALAAIDVAVWDVIGKKYGEPICNLLGGKIREEVPVYASGWCDGITDPVEWKKRAKLYKDMGFTSFKSDPIPWEDYTSPYRNVVTRKDVDTGIDLVWQWREVLGRDAEISVDLHGRLDYDLALRFMHGTEGANLIFVEEPLIADDEVGYQKLCRNTSVPLAAGERWFTRWGHRTMMEDRVLRVAQPDFAHCAGLWEAKKMAANAELYGALIAPHNSNHVVSTLAAIHVGATISNFYRQEFMLDLLEDDVKINKTPIKLVNGAVSLKDAIPGLGFTPDFDALSAQDGPKIDTLDW